MKLIKGEERVKCGKNGYKDNESEGEEREQRIDRWTDRQTDVNIETEAERQPDRQMYTNKDKRQKLMKAEK